MTDREIDLFKKLSVFIDHEDFIVLVEAVKTDGDFDVLENQIEVASDTGNDDEIEQVISGLMDKYKIL